jgi:fucose permease
MMNSSRLLTAGGFLSFFAFGFIDNLKGPLLPELMKREELSFSQAGTVLFAGYLGFVAATLATGVMADFVSNRSVLLLAAISLCLGSAGLGWTSSYVSLVTCMVVIGVGLGAIELGANGLMVELHSAARGRFLNLLATCHGCGSLLVPIVAAWMITRGASWREVYVASLALSAPLMIVFWPRRSSPATDGEPPQADALPEPSPSTSKWRSLAEALFTKRMSCYLVLIAAYVAVELSVAAWLVEFLQRERQMTIGTSSAWLSGFFVLIMLGRLGGAVVVERVQPFTAIFVALSGAAVCLLAGIFGPSAWACLLVVSGLFMSIVFPTVTASVTRLLTSNTGTILGVLFAFGGLGGALGPWIVGLASERFGLEIGLACSVGFAGLAIAALFCLRGLSSQNGDEKVASGRGG